MVEEVRRCESRNDEGAGREPDQQERAPAPREGRCDEDAGGQRHEARLREREHQANGHDGDHRGRCEHDPQGARPEHDHERGEHRDDEKAPVDRGVPEERVDPVERRVGVGDEQLRVPEDVSCDPLLDPDDGEDQRHQDKLSEQGERPEAAPIEACERDGEQAERKVEREQLDCALVEVLRPGERQARPAHEGCERQRDGAELSRARIALDQLPRQGERGGRDHRVERDQQVRLGRADRDRDPGRDAGEGGEGEQPGPAEQQRRPRGGDHDSRDRRSGEHGGVPLRREVDRERECGQRPGDEPCQPVRAGRREQKRHEPGRSDGPGGPCELGRHPRGLTIARA